MKIETKEEALCQCLEMVHSAFKGRSDFSILITEELKVRGKEEFYSYDITLLESDDKIVPYIYTSSTPTLEIAVLTFQHLLDLSLGKIENKIFKN